LTGKRFPARGVSAPCGRLLRVGLSFRPAVPAYTHAGIRFARPDNLYYI